RHQGGLGGRQEADRVGLRHARQGARQLAPCLHQARQGTGSMNPIIHREFPQHQPDGTPDPRWVAMRCGKWTASHAGTIMSNIGKRGGMTKGLDDLIKLTAWGRVHGPSNEGAIQTPAMRRGNEMEPEGREWYMFATDALVDEVGFVEHASIPHVGWSPDG